MVVAGGGKLAGDFDDAFNLSFAVADGIAADVPLSSVGGLCLCVDGLGGLEDAEDGTVVARGLASLEGLVAEFSDNVEAALVEVVATEGVRPSHAQVSVAIGYELGGAVGGRHERLLLAGQSLHVSYAQGPTPSPILYTFVHLAGSKVGEGQSRPSPEAIASSCNP